MPLRFGFYAEGCGRTRKAALRRHVLNGGRLARVHVFVRRLPMMHRWQGPKASNPTAYAWFVWNTRHVGPPTLHRIPYDACEDGR
jgi:hypothetical protein